MRYIPLSEAKPDMKLGMEVYDSFGHILLNKDVLLTEDYIRQLKSLQLDGLYIDDPMYADVQVDTLISNKLRNQGIICVRERDVKGCSKVAYDIVRELLNKDSVCLELSSMKASDDFTYYHSVNVALFACAIGISMNLPQQALAELTTAGMLHDIGKTKIPRDILNKNERLSPEEFQIMKSHAELSYNEVKNSKSLSSDIKEAILSHHENVDGSGYPNGTTGPNQSLYTKILHVADVYDALTSNRPYKKAYSTSDAIEYMMGGCGILFDYKVVKSLVSYVPLYPRGHQMRLDDGRSCIVVHNQGKNNLRPVVRLMDGTTIDLSDKNNLNLTIAESNSVAISSVFEQERKVMIGELDKSKILIVDDMLTNIEALKNDLADYYDITAVKSGRQAISYINKNIRNLPDLILMDIDMPDINGIDSALKINDLTTNHVPILFITSIGDQNTVLACRKAKAAGYILRPYKSVYLKAEIKRIITGTNDAEA